MIKVTGENIITPLGSTSEETLHEILEGKTALCLHKNIFGLPEPFYASLLNREKIDRDFEEKFGPQESLTFFERLAVLSASDAIAHAGIEVSDDDVLIVVSSTKGNVSLLEVDLNSRQAYLSESASSISRFLGNRNVPVVVSNACISGVCAQIYAIRELLSGRYRHAVIIGCDVLSKFIISGFQSFKALSSDACRPYDADRCGLNLGEGAATIILSAEGKENDDSSWYFSGCSIHNDANHISGPSRTGEGAYRVLSDLMRNVEKTDLAMISGHGTATLYNDEMESIAINRADLGDIPLSGLKGFLGHTLGAAGIIETILCMKALDQGIVLPTKGFQKQGTSGFVNVSDKVRETNKREFIKILSGFGGCNAGIAYKKGFTDGI
ncbi:MAG: beta-ketoacyl synthase [Muribaculaceae bacterium]|nr:beta-ketoacyl synthase [Muribaculaceae bacterium]